jgi:carboxymethylenebutenolidase
MKGEMIRFNGGAETYEGYLAPSDTGSGPGVIVIQEWWGLVEHIKDVCDRFSSAGFTALAPDLYRGKTANGPDEAGELMMALNIGETEQILRRAIAALKAHPSVRGDKVGVVGFCMGGQLALFAAATNPEIGACVDFYGIHPHVKPEFENLQGPVLGIFAERDEYASPEAVRALDRELTEKGKEHEFKTYPDTDHAFFNDTRREVYNDAAAKDAWERVTEFLRDRLETRD